MEFPEHFARLYLPFSWHVAAELAWRVEGSRVHDTWPIPDHYDCLSIWGPGFAVDLNRGGSIHAVVRGARTDRPPVPMDDLRELLVRPDGAATAVARVLEFHGLPLSGRRPATTAHVLMYRVIAEAISMDFFKRHVDCRSLAPIGLDAEPVRAAPVGFFADVPVNEIWVLGGDRPLAHLARGWAVTAGGDVINLLGCYDNGESVRSLAARVSAPPSRRTAEAVPRPSGSVAQAGPVWPSLPPGW